MPRPTAEESITRKAEQKKLTREKIKQKAIERGKRLSRASKDRIRLALGEGFLSYTELLKKSGLSKRAFHRHIAEMLLDGEISRTMANGKRGYCLAAIRNYESLEVFAISVLHQRLTDIDGFNKLLGSLVAYTLRNYEIEPAMNILRTVFFEVEGYIKPPPPNQDQRLALLGVPAITQNAESAEWALWREIDSRKYVTTVTMQGKDKVVNKEAFDMPRFQRDWLNKTLKNR